MDGKSKLAWKCGTTDALLPIGNCAHHTESQTNMEDAYLEDRRGAANAIKTGMRADLVLHS